jgi:hypothetical protein
MLTGVFRNRAAASRTFDWLQRRGYSAGEINILMSDATRAVLREGTSDEERFAAKSMVGEGTAAGGAIGTAIGATLGAIVAAGAGSILVPGIGWVAGPVVMALAGGGAGAVAGGVIGALTGLGISESNAKAYEKALQEGGVVLGVVSHSDKDERDIKAFFEEHGGENVIAV